MADRGLFTSIDNETWEQGLQWVRKFKNSNYSLHVINIDLKDEYIDKLRDLNVIVIGNNNKTGVVQIDIFDSFLASKVDEYQFGKYLFLDNAVRVEDIMPLWGISVFGAAKSTEPVNIPSLVYHLASIAHRVKFGEQIKTKVVEEQGNVLCADLMGGTLDGWRFFVGFYKSLLETGIIESTSSRNLAINLFALYFKQIVEGKSLIFTLQSKNPE